MKRYKFWLSMALLLLLVPSLLLAGGQKEGAAQRSKVTFFWALYDGLTESYRISLQDAFMKAHPDIEVDIVPVDWNLMETKVTTSLAGGNPPELSVIGTRWLLEYMATDSVAEVTDYVSKSTIDNIAPGAQEAKFGGKLMAMPIVAGARIMAVNNAITQKIPMTMEELRQEAIRVNDPPRHSGLIMPGKLFTELTDFAYYLYAAGGEFFETRPDGSFGKAAFNGPAGVKALEFMVQLAVRDKVVPQGYLSLDRMDSHPLFYEGKAAYVFIGAWAESALKQGGATFPVTYAQIPPFQGAETAVADHHRLGGHVQGGQKPGGGRQVPGFLLPGRVEGQVRRAGGLPADHHVGGQAAPVPDAAVQGPGRGGHERQGLADDGRLRPGQRHHLERQRQGLPGPDEPQGGPRRGGRRNQPDAGDVGPLADRQRFV
jgi:ABC-type glycerol-3-phosphate transport system substrate-binding protein